MKKLLFVPMFVGCLIHSPISSAQQDFEISGNVGFVSDYVFRGISQSDESLAVQGGFDVSHNSGLYAGVWASNIDFNDGDEAHVEADLYAGFQNTIGQFSYDVGVIYYAYPGADNSLNYDFWELALSLGYDFDFMQASASVNYSPDYFASSDNAVYYAAGIDIPVVDGLTLSGHVGLQTIEDEQAFFGRGANSEENYLDWSIGLGYNLAGFDLSVQYVDTDLDEPVECLDGCAERVIFGISRSF